MADKVLDADYIKNLLARKSLGTKQAKKAVVATIAFSDYGDPRGYDPLKLTQCGYQQPGDRADIWTRWVAQGRTGAADLIARFTSE